MSVSKAEMGQQLLDIVAKSLALDGLAKELEAMEAKLNKDMIATKTQLVEAGNFSALRYESVSYEPDAPKLLIALDRYKDKTGLETLMPRKPAVAEIRKVIDGVNTDLAAMHDTVRACCTRHVEWKMKIGKAKKKAEVIKVKKSRLEKAAN